MLSYHPQGTVRRLFYRWFFSTKNRVAMFQIIVGTTIANLIAAGIIAGLAAAVGLIHLSFSWSWSTYRSVVVLIAVPFILLFGLFILYDLHEIGLGESDKTKKQALFSNIMLFGPSACAMTRDGTYSAGMCRRTSRR